MLQGHRDVFRLVLVCLTVVYLAFAAQAALSGLFPLGISDTDSVTLEVRQLPDAPPGWFQFRGLVVDGVARRVDSITVGEGWDAEGDPYLPAYLHYHNGAPKAAISFRAGRFVAGFASNWNGSVRVIRNGVTVQQTAVHTGETGVLIAAGDSPGPMSWLIFALALLIFAGAAWRLAPIRPYRVDPPWLLFFLSVLHILYWASHAVGTNNDSPSYLGGLSNLLSGVPSYFPPGYPIFLGVFQIFPGSLGAWVTLAQHAMMVVAAYWLYILLRLLVSERLALVGALLAGTISPAFILPQTVLSETTTYFAMVGCLFFGLRASQDGSRPAMIISGVLAGWAVLLRAVPLVALGPALVAIAFLMARKHRKQLLMTTGTAAALVILIPVMWFWLKSGDPQLSDSAWLHMFNRVVLGQKELASDSPATRKLVALLAPQDPRTFSGNWAVLDDPRLSTLRYDDRMQLLTDVSKEGILQSPSRFLGFTFDLAWQVFITPTAWIPWWPDTRQPVPALEARPVLPYTSSAASWTFTMDAANELVWPALCILAIAGTLIALTGQMRIVVAILAWIPISYMLCSAATEQFCPRYNGSIAPIIAAMAVLPFRPISQRLARLAIVGLTVVCLALAAYTTLGFLFTSSPPPTDSVSIEISGPPTDAKLELASLMVDGKSVRLNKTDYANGWEDLTNGGSADTLRYKEGSNPAVLNFRGGRFVAAFWPDTLPRTAVIKRNGSVVQTATIPTNIGMVAIGDPVTSPSMLMFVIALIGFGALAWRFGPLVREVSYLPWLAFSLGTLHFLYWATNPIGTNAHSPNYLPAFATLLQHLPSYYPIGYPILVGITGKFAGWALGTSLTLLQHAFVVTAAVWIYLLLRRSVSEHVAAVAAILAGVISPAFTVPQSITQETAAYFAMLGSIFFAVLAVRRQRWLLMAVSGAFTAWAMVLPVRPGVVVVPAVLAIALLCGGKLRFFMAGLAAVTCAVLMMIPGIWYVSHSSPWRWAYQSGSHLFDRVVIDQKALNPEGPATRRLTALLEGRDPRTMDSEWQIRNQPRMAGYQQFDALIANVCSESISADPVGYAFYAFPLSWRMFITPTAWIPHWPDSDAASSVMETSPLFPITPASLNWRWTLDRLHEKLWPFLCWLAIAGAVLGAIRRKWMWLLLAWIPLAFLLSAAISDPFTPDINGAIAPVVAALAALPLALASKEGAQVKATGAMAHAVQKQREDGA